MSIEAWLLFCLTEAVLCLQPGPSTLAVVSQSLARGTSGGLRATAGVLAANAIYFALSATGLVALHGLSSEAFAVVKWCGAAYLLWVGARALLRSFRRTESLAPPREPAAGGAFWRGFLTQGANPNLLVYFTAILPQFVHPDHPVAPQVALLAASSFAIEFWVLFAYSGASGRARQALGDRFQPWLDRAGGGLLIGAAAGIARLERS